MTHIQEDPSALNYQQTRIHHWDTVAQNFKHWGQRGGYYRQRLQEVFATLIPSGQRVLEIGCSRGDLLAAMRPAYGVGIDFSAGMVKLAREAHPELTFIEADAHSFELNETFDYIILSDLLNDLWDVQLVLEQVKRWCTPHTRIILNAYSRLWEMPLLLASNLGLAKPRLYQNWLTVEDMTHLLNLSGFDVIRSWSEVLMPVRFPLIDSLCNRYLVKLGLFRWMAVTNFVVARPQPVLLEPKNPPVVTVVVPARNEAGNVEAIFARTPEMGAGTELVFVEGNSSDNTYETIQAAIQAHPERRCQLFKQTGKGKGDAVRLGYQHAEGDVLMILDADLTVPPEDLPRFYHALANGQAEFVNGVRLVYPMEKEAMRFANLLGNKFFSLAFSWLLGQPVKDSLCGTKVLWKQDYLRVAANRHVFGDFDPFGDFDLLFGAARLNLKIVDLPIRYRERTYGSTNIQRWKHGVLLLRMVLFAANKIKFI
ncbi:MAG: bifunctional class I SAM-dependent methyltransferase/glycosyltransferase family 2 protein [Anaerolineae bacterium]|nr:bifunctional class I SAM-dependent methyltransferase/glycosyltransferase family 2 protein [Anaerolineae bacterium]